MLVISSSAAPSIEKKPQIPTFMVHNLQKKQLYLIKIPINSMLY